VKAEPVTDPVAEYTKVAAAVRQMGNVGKKLQKTGLTEHAIVLLLHDATRVGKPAIRKILKALPELPDWCLVKPEPKGK
jgi:hypothetical protein